MKSALAHRGVERVVTKPRSVQAEKRLLKQKLARLVEQKFAVFDRYFGRPKGPKVGAKRKGLPSSPSRPAILAPDRVAATFRMSKGQLAETIGLKRDVFYKEARIRAPKTQTRMREMLETVHRIADWAGGEAQALAWYRSQPIPAFGGRTAESLVKSGQASALRDYLDQIAMGGFA
jgi:hypothetical protein